MSKVTDLTFSSGQRKQPHKRVILSNGTTKEVTFKEWHREITKNPTGPTAEMAVSSNDPDLKKVGIPIIRHQTMTGPQRVSPEVLLDESEKIDRRRGLGVGATDLRVSNVTKETATKRGFVAAEDGKRGPS